MDIDFERSQ